MKKRNFEKLLEDLLAAGYREAFTLAPSSLRTDVVVVCGTMDDFEADRVAPRFAAVWALIFSANR